MTYFLSPDRSYLNRVTDDTDEVWEPSIGWCADDRPWSLQKYRRSTFLEISEQTARGMFPGAFAEREAA